MATGVDPARTALVSLAAAPERDAHDIGAGLFLELLHEMGERKRERAVAERAGPRFRQRHELGDRPHLEGRIDDERERIDEQADDRLEILLGIERKALEQELIVDDRLARQDADRVAVGRRFRAGARSDIQPAARPVLHHDRLAPGLVQLVGERPGKDVAASAGGERNDHLDGTRGIVLSRRRRTQCEPGGGGNDRSDEKPQTQCTLHSRLHALSDATLTANGSRTRACTRKPGPLLPDSGAKARSWEDRVGPLPGSCAE